MPRGAQALLCVIALITVIALAVVPVVEARPKNKKAQSETTTEVTSEASGDTVGGETAAQTTGNGGDERTLLSSDADGDYIPDALDNCPNVQNPDQADSDGDGVGDACPIYYDTDGDGVPDKEDNCPGVATDDFRDTDGDGIGDPCDKSPDGVEPEPVQVADYVDQGEPAAAEPELVNGANQDGRSIERAGRSRSRQRTRTEVSEPIITTGSSSAETDDGVLASEGEVIAAAEDDWDGVGSEGEVITEGPDAQPYEPPARDNPRRNEALIAEAAASGELYAEPQPPPVAQRAWEDVAAGDWQVVARIDSGANVTAASGAGESQAKPDTRKAKQKKKPKKKKNANKQQKQNQKRNGKKKTNRQAKASEQQADVEADDAVFARGWSLAAVRLQEDVEPGDGDPGEADGNSPVPVENGLVLSGGVNGVPEAEADRGSPAESPAPVEDGLVTQTRGRDKGEGSKRDGSRRNGSSRAAAAPAARADSASAAGAPQAPAKKKSRNTKKADQKQNTKSANRKARAKERKRQRSAKARQKTEQRTGQQDDWRGDRYFDGGAVLDYRDDFEVAGTDDQDLYLTARVGEGPGKKRGFAYAIPVKAEGVYLVRLYFVEPDDLGAGQRVFTVSAEGDDLVESLDLTAEAGLATAIVKQAEVRIDDGTLDLEFVASEGAPIVSAIEVLEPAR